MSDGMSDGERVDLATEVARKEDEAKPRMDLVPPHAVLEIARCMTYGADKYGEDNYLRGGGLDPARLLAAGLRHINAYQRGEEIDPESGLAHLAHAAASLAMLIEVIARER